ncbi:MAG TPA: nitronate monooxygenase [Jatrophihabitans sp.]|nr:nitronate monooxygenase [Jatrophihabitans sp.]
MILDDCELPIVLAPLAGGPATPELAAAVSNAGGLGFVAGGYLTASRLAETIAATRALTERPYGVNLFVPGRPAPDRAAVDRYAALVTAEATAIGAPAGPVRHDDDDWEAKLALLLADPPPVVSFTFGFPDRTVLRRLRTAGAEAWLTVGSPDEAAAAAGSGADALVVQGAEAGGHRGGPADDPAGAVGLLALLQLVAARVRLPLVASGGIATGAGIAAVLGCGARAAALGTAFLDCREAGTAAVHRAALHGDAPTAYTRAFTGRTARGIRNDFLNRHSAEAPEGYPEVHHLTAPMRRAARTAGLPELVNLWAGQAYPLSRSVPAGELVRTLADEARDALARAAGLLPGPSRPAE